MSRLGKFISKTLSVRISFMVVCPFALLLSAALLVMFIFSRKAVEEEALQKAEQTLDATLLNIDNILLSVEQSAGNIYYDLLFHLDQPDRMFTYCRQLLEANPYITGCAIAFEPDYYKEHGQYFMAYMYRSRRGGLSSTTSPIIQKETFGNVPYSEQVWYTKPMETGSPCWLGPLKGSETDGEAIITFSLPVFAKGGQKVGVMGVDMSLSLLSDIVLSAKPSPNSYATLLGSDGSYIVHPDKNKILRQTIADLTDPSAKEAAQLMVSGETGYRFFRLKGEGCYVFYKPFKRAVVPGRSTDDIGWSVGIIYPEDDIFGDYRQLLYVVLAVACAGLLLLFILCQLFTHRLLMPLRMLTQSAQRIADGHYDEPIPDSHQHDEVGSLQHHFQQMQLALAAKMSELDQLTASLKERGEVLGEAYEQAKEADRMKTTFLHNMTNQMIHPVGTIITDVSELCDHCQDMSRQQSAVLVDRILEQSTTVTELLNDLLEVSQDQIKDQKKDE